MTSDTTVKTGAVAEREAILHWRYDQLCAAGYSDKAASVLSARGDVDLHLATDLLAMGCPPATALRILL